MDTGDNILSFMDILDLDEEMVDMRLKTIMLRSNYTKKHLTTAVHLLKYKKLINLREDSECDNDEECSFIAKLIEGVLDENIDIVCKIVNIVLSLNTNSIVSKSEHLLQQILSDVDLSLKYPKQTSHYDMEDEKTSRMLVNFKICNSILDAVVKSGEKLSLYFLETPLENVLNSSDEKLKLYFLTNIVPKLFEAAIGYNILDRIWDYLKQLEHINNENALKILCSLSEFFLPVTDSKGNKKFESEIIFHCEFWTILQYGLMSNDPSVRKLSIYLMKRAIDCLSSLKKDASVHTEVETLFTWNSKIEIPLKQMWDNFFILIDSLEEKQSNIVLPSLKLFDSLNNPAIGNWLDCAFNIGLQHDNTQVRLKCIEYKLKFKINNVKEAKTLLEALNDTNIFDQDKDCTILKDKIAQSFRNDDNNFINILKALPEVKWSSVPFYHLSCVFSDFNWENQLNKLQPSNLTKIIIAILEVPCNNIPIRNAVKINISHMIKDCNNLKCNDLLYIYSSIKWDSYSLESKLNNPLILKIKKLILREHEKKEIFVILCESHSNIGFALLYLDNHEEDIGYFLNVLNEKTKKVQEIVSRQYSEKSECFKDVIFIAQMFNNCINNNGDCEGNIKATLARESGTMLQYALSLLSTDSKLTIEEIALFIEGFNLIVASANSDLKEIILQLYKASILLFKDVNTDLDKKVLALFIVNTLKDNQLILNSYEHEMLNLIQVLEMVKGVNFKESCDIKDNGRYRNIIYEKICEVLYSLLKDKDIQRNLNRIEDFIENMTECGGYGCLKWILKIMNKILLILLTEQKINFNVGQFFGRMWKEIEELKSNNQYSPCIKEFTNLLVQGSLLTKSMYNNIVTQYCNKIIEYAPLKNTGLFYLVRNLHEMNMTTDHGQIVYVLCDILLYSPVPKKDHRIAENIAVEILQNVKYGLDQNIDCHFNFQIQYLALSTLCKIKHKEIFQIIFTLMAKRIEDVLMNKQRYHGNSQMHRTLLIALQHRLMFFLLHLDILESEDIVLWSIELLGRLPHQPSVRICLEWFIALHIYLRRATINKILVDKLGLKDVPVTSQFSILYWALKHKIVKGDYLNEEFEFVMDTLLSHTMGQMFNLRLHAQYLATKLYEMNKINKYDYIIEVIQKTFIESSKDKNFVKLKEDFFANEFDIVKHLTPSFIYYFLPRYCDVGRNEKVDEKFIKNVSKVAVDAIMSSMIDNDFNKEWRIIYKSDDEVLGYKLSRTTDASVADECSETLGTIQKKYIPWKNMSDIDVYECGKKKESPSELIIVASLIDKLPNLGGMARTSEVFGVNTYVVNSLRHLQDKQFQGLSVSAERWVNIEEVRPGAPLMRYLTQKSSEGYSIIAAEQTSTSCQLQNFKFPKKTLLLLGHEKEGIPCELLPLMDHCVEIPQQGFVRSLNVHVTAAIFIWEYSRQNILHL